MRSLQRRLAAEVLGTGFLVAAVVGSGIMAERLTDDVALALLCSTVATGAILVVLISILGPISGAHLNPAVTAAIAAGGGIIPVEALLYVGAQLLGGIVGTLTVHSMFAEAVMQLGDTARSGMPLWLSEVVAAFGLVAVVLAGATYNAAAVPWLVGLYISSAYWFTASTSFANPAVTIARSLTESFSGIRPSDAPGFIAAQLAGALLAVVLMRWLLAEE